MPPIMIRTMSLTRRELLQLSSFALLARCARSEPVMPAEAAEGRLHARPSLFQKAGAATPKPRPLGLGRERDGHVYVPKAEAAALMLYLHGAGGSGEWAMQRLVEDADRTGTIVLAPDSRGQTWGFSGAAEAEDLAFLDDALEQVFTSYRIDPKRVAIAGFSDGASMALSWGLPNGDLFPAIVAFSPGFVSLPGPPQGQPRIFLSHGTRDEILPIERCGRKIAAALKKSGYAVDYREFEGEHTVPPFIRRAGFDALQQS